LLSFIFLFVFVPGLRAFATNLDLTQFQSKHSVSNATLGPNYTAEDYNADHLKLKTLQEMSEEALPVGPAALTSLGKKIRNGQCISLDTRTGKLFSRAHTLHLIPDPKNPTRLYVYGTASGDSRPAGLTPLTSEGRFTFNNSARQGNAEVGTTVDDNNRPVLVTSARATNGLTQYCQYPLDKPLLGINDGLH
jgi:hypothetical protein